MTWAGVIPFLLLSSACQPAKPSAAPAHIVISDGMVDIGGTSLHIHCLGEGAPAVVFDSGLGNDGGVWRDVQPEVGRTTRACVYDRAGLGYSAGPASKPHTNRQMARELHALLKQAGIAGPYVLVGHSMGGVNVRLFADEHLDELAGMVLVDAVTDEQPARYWSLLSKPELAEFGANMSELHEGIDFDTFVAGISEMRASSRSVGDRPLVVLTRGKEPSPPGAPPDRAPRMLQAWHQMQSELPRLSSNGVQIVATNSGHFIQWDAPRLVTAAVVEVVDACRTHRSVTEKTLAPIANGHTP